MMRIILKATLVLCFIGCYAVTDVYSQKKSNFSENVIRLLESQQFSFKILRVATKGNYDGGEPIFPKSYIILDKEKIAVRIPYFYDISTGEGETKDNFSDSGRMLSFENSDAKITRSALSKNGKTYNIEIQTYGNNGVQSFLVTITASVRSSYEAVIVVDFANRTESYYAILNQNL